MVGGTGGPSQSFARAKWQKKVARRHVPSGQFWSAADAHSAHDPMTVMAHALFDDPAITVVIPVMVVVADDNRFG
jgi:hypothetical protein